MLAWKDCLEPARLDENESMAAGRANDLPQLAVMELEHYLATCPVSGQNFLRPTILDDLKSAEQAGDRRRVVTLKLALQRFIQTNRPSSAA
jgi:hypothetical protein